METNFFGLCVCVLQVTLAYKSIVLCMVQVMYLMDIQSFIYLSINYFKVKEGRL